MKKESLEEKIKKCIGCALCKEATNVVPGEGNLHANIMIIGEAPGRKEDLQGQPFVGAAGKILSQMLEAINLKREDVFITNIVKCRPPKNRDPKPEEVKACWPWLEQQIKTIKPEIIVTLGRHSLKRFLPDAKIAQTHGNFIDTAMPPLGKLRIFSSYHPAAAIYNQKLKKTLFDDFERLKKAK